jgi:hypothetical protein
MQQDSSGDHERHGSTPVLYRDWHRPTDDDCQEERGGVETEDGCAAVPLMVAAAATTLGSAKTSSMICE